jgi:hypothetical protein
MKMALISIRWMNREREVIHTALHFKGGAAVVVLLVVVEVVVEDVVVVVAGAVPVL